MQEIEFKFQVPVKKRKALQKAFTLLKAEPNHLAAQYFDTADQTLAKHCIAIRRRQENDEMDSSSDFIIAYGVLFS